MTRTACSESVLFAETRRVIARGRAIEGCRGTGRVTERLSVLILTRFRHHESGLLFSYILSMNCCIFIWLYRGNHGVLGSFSNQSCLEAEGKGRKNKKNIPGTIYVKLRNALSIWPTWPAFLVIKSSYMPSHFGGMPRIWPTPDCCDCFLRAADMALARVSQPLSLLQSLSISSYRFFPPIGGSRRCSVFVIRFRALSVEARVY